MTSVVVGLYPTTTNMLRVCEHNLHLIFQMNEFQIKLYFFCCLDKARSTHFVIRSAVKIPLCHCHTNYM
jgi:hypothetical protein